MECRIPDQMCRHTFRIITMHISNTTGTFKDHHNVSATFGTESHKTLKNITDVEGRSLVGANQEIGSSSPATMVSMKSYTDGERYLRSFFARADYKFMDKYLVGVKCPSRWFFRV